MIGRLSITITGIKEFVYRHRALRLLCYLLVMLSLLFFWLYSDTAGVAFVYNAF